MISKLFKYFKNKTDIIHIFFSDIKKKAFSKTGSSFHTKIMLAAISFFISLLIWVFIAWNGNNDGTKNINVSIQYDNLPTGYIIYTPIKKVDVKVAGRISILSRLEPSDIKATVDLQGLSVGEYNLPIKVEAPVTVRLRSWNKTAVPVELSRFIERKIPLTWRLDGELPKGKVISSVEITPIELTVGGPEVDILAIQTINAVLPISKLDKSSDLRAALEIIGPEDKKSIDRISISVQFVNVKVKLEDEMQADKIPVKVSVLGYPREGLELDSIKVTPEKVSIHGKGSALSKMKELVLPPIDITGLEQNIQLMVPLQTTDLDSEIEITGPDSARVEITVRKKITSKTFTNVAVALFGATSSEFKISPQLATLTIEGSQSSMNSLHSSNVPCTLYVDVSNVVSKQLTLPILVKNLEDGFYIKKIEPEEVVVTNLN